MIDFPEEEIDIDEEALLAQWSGPITGIQTLADSYYEGNAIRHGLQVLIVGRTNVGKSSLLNALLARERAIVTPLQGTTRDMIEDIIHIHGIKLRIIDTAGMGVARDIVETEGIERVKRKIPEADLLLWIIDGSPPLLDGGRKGVGRDKRRPRLVVVNKADLPQAVDPETLRLKGLSWMEVSALRTKARRASKRHLRGLNGDKAERRAPPSSRTCATSRPSPRPCPRQSRPRKASNQAPHPSNSSPSTSGNPSFTWARSPARHGPTTSSTRYSTGFVSENKNRPRPGSSRAPFRRSPQNRITQIPGFPQNLLKIC